MKDLQFLTNALDAAIKAGVYNLQEAGQILQSINSLGNLLQQVEASNKSAKDLGVEPLEKPEPKAKMTKAK